MAGRRILRSGKEFSAYDLAIGAAVSPPQYFSVADCLKQRLEAQQFTQILDEPVNIIPTPRPPSPPTSSPSLSPPACPPSPPPFWVARDFPAKQAPATKLNSKKLGSKRRKRERRELDASQAQDPGLKAIHRERRAAAKKNALQTDFDVIDLPHSTPSWIGKRSSEDGTQAPNVGTLPTSSARAIEMGSRVYTQEELNCMSGTDGFTYIDWLGELTIPIIDSHRRLIALLGGKPKDLLGWKKAPGELCNHPDNIEITDEMLEHECFQRIVGFANCLFRIFAPILFTFYQAQMALLVAWNSALKWPFIRNGYMTDEDFFEEVDDGVEGGSGCGGRDALGRGCEDVQYHRRFIEQFNFFLINLYKRRLEPILVIRLITNTLRMYRPLR
ncbi:hypothetical protein B0H14DRAFT_3609235 [Mycena olivaceomarginata]|nr:hypothetical protein B0H14DRAFT_3609235 [Mycena olivaceomarginata]